MSVELDARTRAGHAAWDAAAEEGRWVCDVTATDAPRPDCDCLACTAIRIMDWNANPRAEYHGRGRFDGLAEDQVGRWFGDWSTRLLNNAEPARYRNLEDVL